MIMEEKAKRSVLKSVDIPTELHNLMCMYKINNDITLRELVQEAIEEYLTGKAIEHGSDTTQS